MKKSIILTLAVAQFFICTLYGQNSMPIVKANSSKADIRDGAIFKKGKWTISPEIRNDIYTTSTEKHTVTFYTDIDSISVEMEENKIFQFTVVLNGKDSARTIIHAPDYMALLKKAAIYNTQENREIPVFTYQDSSNSNLATLRKAFNLDSIAGTGNEVSRVINLLHWVHNIIPHDGNHQNPVVKNAMSMIAECKRDNRGLNCRGLATVLNECYLALGIPSRFVTCLPKDSLKIDPDCHVINAVFIKGLNKWVWIDPTNNAYVMNENGELLSIEEVRERLINNKPLNVNPDANWNRRSSTIKAEYLFSYMAKNLYMFECWVSSEYDMETWNRERTISSVKLLPLDYYKQPKEKATRTNEKTKTTFNYYYTNNPGTFWAKPY